MDYSTLSDLELLSQLIGTRKARRLYQGSLTSLFLPDDEERAAVRKLSAARELVKRPLLEELRRGPVLSRPTAVVEYLRSFFLGCEHESFVGLFLDSQNRLLAAEELSRGTLSQTAVYPREVVKRALHFNAGAVIFAHNHPSGVAEPSRADEVLTRSLKEALYLVEIKVLDHLIVVGSTAISFAERGLL